MSKRHPDPELIALGVQQPWAELILRGIKTIEVRSQHSRVRGTIYLYASKAISKLPAARIAADQHEIPIEALPRGRLVGTVQIVDSRPCLADDATATCLSPELLQNQYAWVLEQPKRLRTPLEVRFLPYGVWFYPFQRRNQAASQD